jgi:NADPH:quinone reductase-like Zn-dependent oxidoreductase
MRGIRTTHHGGPEALQFRVDVPAPEPGKGEVRVKVSAAGLNNTDIWSREGAYGTATDPNALAGWKRVPLEFPLIQGGDVAGTIDAVGSGVSAERKGRRVVVNPVLYGRDQASGGLRDCALLGSERNGGFAEYVVVPDSNAYEVGGPASDAELASLPIAFLTAEHMLFRAQLEAGETLLVTGASGGVGSALVLLGRARDAKVLALTSPAKSDGVAQLGAQPVSREAYSEVGPEALPGGAESVNVVADVVAGEMLPSLLNALAYGGRYVTAGAIGGAVVSFDLRTVYLNQLALFGSTLGTAADFARLVGWAARGELRPPVAAEYPLAELKRAQDHFLRKDFVGNIVVRPELPGGTEPRAGDVEPPAGKR